MAKKVLDAGTLISPLPAVMVSCGDMEKPNIITVAWTGIINSKPPMTYISVRKERFSHGIIKGSGEFVINLPSSDLVRKVDSCGVKSGRDQNKFEAYSLTAIPSETILAPAIKECPVNIECRVREIKELGSHDMFISEIMSVSVDEELINERGRLCLEKASLMSYIHGEYFTIGKKIGSYGFSVKKKRR